MDKETTTSVTIDRKTFARLDRQFWQKSWRRKPQVLNIKNLVNKKQKYRNVLEKRLLWQPLCVIIFLMRTDVSPKHETGS